MKEKIKIYFQKFLSYFVVIFCFLFFPAFLLFSTLNILFESNAENLKQTKLTEMGNILEYMNKYSSNKRYFHFLLSKIADYAQKTDNPKLYLENNIRNLKTRYPEKIQFIVWDNNGKVIKDISDRAKYNYVSNKIFVSLNEVVNVFKDDSSSIISNIESIKKNLKMFRSFFGKIFIPQNLNIPLAKDFSAGPFRTELGHGLTYVWYTINEKISFLCFISDELLLETTGLEKITNELNTNKNGLIFGYAVSSDYEKSALAFPLKYEADLALALSTFENAGDNIFENERAIVRMSMPQSSVRTFCFLPKTDERWDYKYNRNLWFGILFSILLFIYCLCGFLFVYKRHFFSIRWKLTILFLIANLSPIIILGLIGSDYLESQRLNLKNEIVSDLDKSLMEFEARYRSLIDDYSLRLNVSVGEIAKDIGEGVIQEKDITRLESIYDEFDASEMYIIASISDRAISFKGDRSKTKAPPEYMVYFGRAVLRFANSSDLAQSPNEDSNKYSGMVKKADSNYIDSFIKNFGIVSDFSVGGIGRIYYSYCFGNKNIYNNNYLYFLFWDKKALQESFIRDNYKTLYKSFPEADFYIKSNSSNNTYGSEKLGNFVSSVLEKNLELNEKNNGYLKIKDKNYIYTCLNGTNLKEWTLLAVYPEDKINKAISLIIVKIVVGIFLSILLTIIIIHILALQFLKPISNLREATLAIDERKFSHRIPIGDKDEFGHLNQVFNRVIEGLEDFEVARIVQESLFPGNEFVFGDFKMYEKSIVMATLGGDYYDCFKINDEYQGIIIGKVSGRGIPGGLMMAMAKSVVLTASEELKLNPSALSKRLNKMFNSIKNDGSKYMMTFEYFVIHISDGHLKYTNAGHCLPVIVDSKTKTAKFIEYSAPKIGLSIDFNCENKEFNINEGESLILYTDAIVKANNNEGKQFGYERFLSCLPEYYDLDPKVYYTNIIDSVYKKWAFKQEDDITLIIVNR